MSLSSKLRNLNRATQLSFIFYTVTGIILLAFLPLTGFPPHIGFLGIVSLITAYSLFTKRAWAPWLVAILLITNTVFSLFTLYSVGFSNVLVTLSMIAYAVLTWLVTLYYFSKRND